MAKDYSVLPSQLFSISDEHDAYRINRAVWTFGSGLESDLDSVTETDQRKKKRELLRIFEKWIPEAATPLEKKYKDPAAR